MLRRHRQIRMQIQQLLDACIFAFSFWVAYAVRSQPDVIASFGLDPVAPMNSYVWIFVVLIFGAPLVLESQGFYERQMFSSRWEVLWRLLRGCVLVAVGLTILLFYVRIYLPRWVIIWFGCISFSLVFIKEELRRWSHRAEFTKAQMRRRFILVGDPAETARLRREIKFRSDGSIDVLAELDLPNWINWL